MCPLRTDPVLNVVDLVDRPGAFRRVDLALDVPADLAIPLATLRGPVRLAGMVESVVEGVLVRGTVTVDARLSCARCLADVDTVLVGEPVELFSPPTTAPDEIEAGYELREGHIDLDTLLRDTLMPSAPARPLCRPDCAGLCATCGTDRNTAPCACAQEPDDTRWAVLRMLRLHDADRKDS